MAKPNAPMGLFAQATSLGTVPLAERLRPKSLEEIVGQPQLLGPEGMLHRLLKAGHLPSLILWGPPGTGKTTLARLLANKVNLPLVPVSAITTGAAALRDIGEQAADRHATGQATVLFVDEIHRLNRAQQDVFLPYVERGAIVLIGATTENPSFELNAALLSRATVLVLKQLDASALSELLTRAETEEGRALPLTPDARNELLQLADGDGRYLLGLAEQLFHATKGAMIELAGLPAAEETSEALINSEALLTLLAKRRPAYDKSQEQHYNLISALHKSLRGSDTDAALYWLHRMLAGGEQPDYILRRLTRFAAEDIGMADPQALPFAIAAWETYNRLGSPEGDLALTQLVIYLGSAPKSNAAYKAHKQAAVFAAQHGSLPPPMHSVNAPTKLMKELGYNKGYTYDHDTPEGCAGMNYFPDNLPRQNLYRPVERGFEREITKRLAYFETIRQRHPAKPAATIKKEPS